MHWENDSSRHNEIFFQGNQYEMKLYFSYQRGGELVQTRATGLLVRPSYPGLRDITYYCVGCLIQRMRFWPAVHVDEMFALLLVSVPRCDGTYK